MFKLIAVIKDLFLVYSDAKKSGFRVSEQMTSSAGLVVSGSIITVLSVFGVNLLEFTSSIGIPNETIMGIGTVLTGFAFGWLRKRSRGGKIKGTVDKENKPDAVSDLSNIGKGEGNKQSRDYDPLNTEG